MRGAAAPRPVEFELTTEMNMATQQPEDSLSNKSDSTELAHAMLWETYERVTREQAADVTREPPSKPRSPNRRGIP